MHSAGLELTKLTYTRLEDNLVRHQGDRLMISLIVVVVVVLTLTRIIKSGQAPVTLELRNTPGKNTHNPRWYTHISQLTQFTPPPETYKSEIGSQSTMCQVGAYVSLLTPGETKYSDCHPRKTTTYILHVLSITTHTHDRHKSIGEKETKKRRQRKGKKREEKNETRRKRQAKRRKRQGKQEKTRQESKERRREKKKKRNRKRKERKMSY